MLSEEEIIYILKQRIERKTVSSDPYYITQKAIEGILDLYNKQNKIIDKMAEELTTPLHNKKWIIEYFTKLVEEEN